MKIQLKGSFEGMPVELRWEDGQVHGDPVFVGMLSRAALVNRDYAPFPTPEGLGELEDWLSHPRGFVLSAERFLKDVETDWTDEEMKDVIFKR